MDQAGRAIHTMQRCMYPYLPHSMNGLQLFLLLIKLFDRFTICNLRKGVRPACGGHQLLLHPTNWRQLQRFAHSDAPSMKIWHNAHLLWRTLASQMLRLH